MTNGHDQPGAQAQGQNPPASPPSAPQPCYIVVQPPVEEDEISLADLWQALIRHKAWIVGITLLCTAAGAAAAFLMTPVYRAEVVVIPVSGEEGRGGLAALAGQLGGLASLAGVDLGGSGGRKEETLAILRSRAFTERFIRERNLLPVLFADKWDAAKGRWRVDDPDDVPTLGDAWRFFNERVRTIQEDRRTGLVTLAIEWTDPEVAAEWANELVRRANDTIRARDIEEAERSIRYLDEQLARTNVIELQQALYRLKEAQIKKIMLARTHEEYAFRVLDPAVPPEKHVRPNRPLVVALGLLVGLVLGIAGTLAAGGGSERKAPARSRSGP